MRWRRRTPRNLASRRPRSNPNAGSRRSAATSTNMSRRSAQHPDIFPPPQRRARAQKPHHLRAHRSPFARARAAGFIRRIHGDLHLGNIVLIDGRPVLFDAIEFSDIIATGDVFYDLAFLLMDLLERGLARPRTSCSTAISPRRGGSTISTRLPRCRSSSRCARPSAPRSLLPGWSERLMPIGRPLRARRAPISTSRRGHCPAGPAFVAVGGLSGTGEIRAGADVGAAVKPMPGAVIVRSDVERKALFGLSEAEKLPEFRLHRRSQRPRLRHAGDKARRIVAAGHSAIVDAVFAIREERAAIEDDGEIRPTSAAADCFSPPTLRHRLGRVGGRVRDASDADAAVAQAQERYELGPPRMDAGRCLRNAGSHPGPRRQPAPSSID